MGGTKIGGISSNDDSHKFLLRDYYVASSFNSCCGGNVEKDFVDMVPLRQVIKQGARLLDFEIYSINDMSSAVQSIDSVVPAETVVNWTPAEELTENEGFNGGVVFTSEPSDTTTNTMTSILNRTN